MKDKCHFFVPAGAGWCRAKKAIGYYSLFCQKQDRPDKDIRSCCDRLTAEFDEKFHSGFEIDGVMIPKGSYLCCPICAESAPIEIGEDPKCPVCNVPFIIVSPITYDKDGKPFRLTFTANEGKKLKITKRE